MSKEMKNKRMSITWEQKQRQCTPLRAMRKSQKVISRTRQRHSFHKKRFLTAHAGAREREAYKRVSRQRANATRSLQQLLERRTDLAFAQRQQRKHARDDAQMKRRFAASQVFAVDVNGEGGVG